MLFDVGDNERCEFKEIRQVTAQRHVSVRQTLFIEKTETTSFR